MTKRKLLKQNQSKLTTQGTLEDGFIIIHTQKSTTTETEEIPNTEESSTETTDTTDVTETTGTTVDTTEAITEETTTQSATSNTPITGDDTRLLIWMLVLAVSGCGVIGVNVFSQKRNEKR